MVFPVREVGLPRARIGALATAMATVAAALAGAAAAADPAPAGAVDPAADSAAVSPAASLPAGPAGFASPVALIPEIGLWVDGLAQLGFARKTGLALWWDLEPPAAPGAHGLDWRRVTYRIRAEAFNDKGKRAAHEEALVEPMANDGASERGGFPTILKLVLSPGPYRVRVEAYPLISAKAAGLDSVPRGVAEVAVSVPEMNVGSSGWRLSDVLFFRAVRRWEPGAAPERIWYDWVAYPDVARDFGADSSVAHLGFEVLRGPEVVPRCAAGACRVVATFRDSLGAILHQELRPVPEAASVRAYLLPFLPASFAPGTYDVEVEIYEGSELQVAVRRSFRVTAPAG